MVNLASNHVLHWAIIFTPLCFPWLKFMGQARQAFSTHLLTVTEIVHQTHEPVPQTKTLTAENTGAALPTVIGTLPHTKSVPPQPVAVGSSSSLRTDSSSNGCPQWWGLAQPLLQPLLQGQWPQQAKDGILQFSNFMLCFLSFWLWTLCDNQQTIVTLTNNLTL